MFFTFPLLLAQATTPLKYDSPETITAQAKERTSAVIKEFSDTVNNCDEFSDLIDNRVTFLESKIASNRQSLKELSTIMDLEGLSVTESVDSIIEEYEYEITNIKDVRSNLIKTRPLFFSQLIELNNANSLPDPNEPFDNSAYQKLFEALDEDSLLYSDISVSIAKSLENFKSSIITNDEYYREEWIKIQAVFDFIEKNLDVLKGIRKSSIINSDSDEVISFVTKYFKARVGTTWGFNGYSKEQGKEDVENNNDIKMVPYNKKLTVLNIHKNNDGYLLEISNSKTGENENWLVTDQEFSDGTSYITFPLSYGKRWLSPGEDDGSEWAEMTKNRADGFYQNRVEEVLENKVLGNDCYVVGYNTLPDRFYSIFCDNIGIVEEFYKHNGTISEHREQLVRYRY